MSDNIVDLGAFRMSHVREADMRGEGLKCEHRNLELDDRGHVVRCKSCGAQVSSYWALRRVLDEVMQARASLRAREEALARSMSESLHLLAARRLERIWQGRTMTPACPHCPRGILAEDVSSMVKISTDLERRRRAAISEKDKLP